MICATRGCRRERTAYGAYCRPCHAEHMRAWRAQHARTPWQITNDRQRNRRNKRLRQARAKKAAREQQVPRPLGASKTSMALVVDGAGKLSIRELQVPIPVTREPPLEPDGLIPNVGFGILADHESRAQLGLAWFRLLFGMKKRKDDDE